MAEPNDDLGFVPEHDDLGFVPDEHLTKPLHEVLSDSTKKFLTDNKLHGRSDESMFSIDTSKLHDWINQHTPDVQVPSLMPNMPTASFRKIANLPVDIFDLVAGAAGAPENPALMMAGAAKAAIPKIADEIVPQVARPIAKPLTLPAAPERKLLTGNTTNARFIGGAEGVAENRPYTTDITPVTPTHGATVLPREAGELGSISPEMAAEHGTSLEKFGAINDEEAMLQKIERLSNQVKANAGMESGALPGQTQLPSAVLKKPISAIRNERLLSKFDEPQLTGSRLEGFDKKLGEIDKGNQEFSNLTEGGTKFPNVEKLNEQRYSTIREQSEANDSPMPPKSQVNDAPIRAKNIDEIQIPPPGTAKPPRDISAIRTEINSPNIALSKYPSTKPIVDELIGAEDKGKQWIGGRLRELADTTKGLDKTNRETFWELMNGTDDLSKHPMLADRVSQARQIMDSIFDEIPEGASRAGHDVTYHQQYITHMQKFPNELKEMMSYYFGKDSGIYKLLEEAPLGESTGEIGDMFEKGVGHPGSDFTEKRLNQILDLEKDPNKLFPLYVESIAKTIFNAPAVKRATELIKEIPGKSNLKEMATAYVKNFSGYDAQPELQRRFAAFANQIASMSARSWLYLSPKFHMLHLGEIPSSIYPELGEVYTALGFKDTVTRPFQNFAEMARNGLLPTELKPLAFRTAAEKFNSVGQYFSYVESLVKGIAYNGMKRKLLHTGMNEKDAILKAIDFAKNSTFSTDKARQMLVFAPQSPGGEIAVRLGGQFKQIPAKIVERIYNQVADAKNNPAVAARMLAGTAFAIKGTQVGMHTFHMNPSSLLSPTVWGAFGDAMGRIAYDIYQKKDAQLAISDLAAFAIPGGKMMQPFVENALGIERNSNKRMRLRFR